MGTSADTTANRLSLAFDLYEAAEAIVRQNVQRRLPDATAETVEAELLAWLEKPIGLPRSHFRPRRLANR